MEEGATANALSDGAVPVRSNTSVHERQDSRHATSRARVACSPEATVKYFASISTAFSYPQSDAEYRARTLPEYRSSFSIANQPRRRSFESVRVQSIAELRRKFGYSDLASRRRKRGIFAFSDPANSRRIGSGRSVSIKSQRRDARLVGLVPIEPAIIVGARAACDCRVRTVLS